MNSFKNKEIQIVAFAAPYPANYGGVIDVFYKIKALFDLGVKVHLHTYIYDDHYPTKELESICASVHYYKRANTHKYLQGWPYIISTRYNKKLIEQVKLLKHDVILEGLHTCFLVPYLKEAQISFSIRMHNIEWKYYRFLAELELSYVKKKYFLEEARRLKSFEKIIEGSKILSISKKDTEYLHQTYPSARIIDIPPFHHNKKINILSGQGEYAIFHANLSVNENEQAALWLIEKVFNKIEYPLIIAGKNPSERLQLAVNAYPNIQLESNPTDVKMKQLMMDAHIHLLPNRQPTGTKIKWINSLYVARYIIVNPEICPNHHETSGVFVSNDANIIQQTLLLLKDKIFTEKELASRKEWVGTTYNNISNAQLILG